MEELSKLSLMALLKDNNVDKVEVTYSGSGDSGCIDDVVAYDADYKHIDLDSIVSNIDVKEAIEDLSYEILQDKYQYDWYNNEGGYGTIYIHINDLNWNIDGYVYETQTHDAHAQGTLN